MDAAMATLAQAQAAATTGIRAGGDAWRLDRLRSVWIASAVGQLKAFNRQLAFAGRACRPTASGPSWDLMATTTMRRTA
jgi:hypothetical protein